MIGHVNESAGLLSATFRTVPAEPWEFVTPLTLCHKSEGQRFCYYFDKLNA